MLNFEDVEERDGQFQVEIVGGSLTFRHQVSGYHGTYGHPQE